MKIRRFLLFFIVASFVFVITACAPSTEKGYTAYQKNPFRAELNGTVFGVSFTAVIEKNSTKASLTYLHPEALEGITLIRDGDDVFLMHEDEKTPISKDLLAGLLSPLDILMGENEPLRIQKEKTGYVLSLPKQGTLTLTSDRIPSGYASPDLSFTVAWWEILSNGA